MYETVNRGMLLKAAKAGKLYAKCTGRYTDDYAYDAAANYGIMKTFLPVYIGQGHEHVPGHIVMNEQDFRYKSGRAYKGRGETITLRIHNNLHYDLEVRA